MPKITVIVPVYKVEPYLRRCVDSILNQTFTDFELILVDDGSPDGCGAICDEYIDPRITVIHQPNGGLSAARNSGIDWAFACSDSEWLGFVDSDDWVHSKYLEALHRATVHTHTEIVIAGFERTEGESPVVDESKLSETIRNVEQFYCEQNVEATVAWGKLYRRHCFTDIRYPVGKLHEDEFVTYRILFQNETVTVIDLPLYAYYQNMDGIMKSGWNPRRMDVFLARHQQVRFLKGHQEARRRQAAAVLDDYASTIELLEKNGEYIYLLPNLYKGLRKYLIEYCGIVSWKDIPYPAEKAFPRFMKYYWIINAQIEKLRR